MNAILAILFFVASALAGTPAEKFQDARLAAIGAAGTPEFRAAWELAERKCTPRVRRETACDVALIELRRTDREQREYLERKAEEAEEAAIASRPVTARVAAPLDLDDDEGSPAPALRTSAQAAPARQVRYVDQPTGLGYVAGLRDPGAPWSGLAVTLYMQSMPQVSHACVMKEGIPLPVGGDIPVSRSDERGTPVFSCAAARVSTGTTLYVPERASIALLRFNADRQVYVVEETLDCAKTKSDRVQSRGSKACPSR